MRKTKCYWATNVRRAAITGRFSTANGRRTLERCMDLFRESIPELREVPIPA